MKIHNFCYSLNQQITKAAFLMLYTTGQYVNLNRFIAFQSVSYTFAIISSNKSWDNECVFMCQGTLSIR